MLLLANLLHCQDSTSTQLALKLFSHRAFVLSPGLIVYLGMMVGAFVWGGLADRIGRRQTLLISLSINSVFAFFSSFVQGYVSFLFCRLASGVG